MKLCVGADSVADLERWQARQRTMARFGHRATCTTRNWPRRRDEVLAGGSLFWVIKGLILVRQRVLAFEPGLDETGQQRCAIVLDEVLVPVRARPCRAFQGWRYLGAADAPEDWTKDGAAADLPPEIETALAAVGVARRRA
jgi:hypothetical protein